MWILLIILGLLLLGALLYWLLIITEGLYLGRRFVVWLYDRTAHKYDGIKEYEDQAGGTGSCTGRNRSRAAPAAIRESRAR
jgi:hypothetical protein